MMPVMGNLTLVVAALAYAGQLNVTAVAARDGCPDVEVFATRQHPATRPSPNFKIGVRAKARRRVRFPSASAIKTELLPAGSG